MKKLLLLCLLCVSCEVDKSERVMNPNNIVYFEDQITHICFAQMGCSNCNNFSFTCVPCDSVRKYSPGDLFIK